MISNRCYYALKAMLELAKQERQERVTISHIADQQGIPTRFLEAILRQLKQGGLTESARGKDGGYYLSRPAETIKVGEVIRLFEGPLVAVRPGNGSGESKKESVADTVYKEIWEKAEGALAAVYDDVSFAELAERERMHRTGAVANYAI